MKEEGEGEPEGLEATPEDVQSESRFWNTGFIVTKAAFALP